MNGFVKKRRRFRSMRSLSECRFLERKNQAGFEEKDIDQRHEAIQKRLAI